jgi:hypothetical protein
VSNTRVWVEQVLATLGAVMQPGDVLAVITSELKFPAAPYVEAQRTFLSSALVGLATTANATLLLLGDFPSLPRNPHSQCRDAASSTQCNAPRDEAVQFCRRGVCPPDYVALHANIDAMLAGVAAQHSPVVRYLPTDWMYDRTQPVPHHAHEA